MSLRKVYVLNGENLSCPIDILYDDKNDELYFQYDLPPDISTDSIFDFYEKCQQMSSIQRQFFLEPTHPTDKEENKYQFVCCPGYYIQRFYTQDSSCKTSCYEKLNEKDRLWIMKCFFSITCSIQILLSKGIKLINIYDKSFFIDSKMEARFSYSNWQNGFENDSTFSKIRYFHPPEKLKRISSEHTQEQNSDNIEKECVYSLGILITTLLTKILPRAYLDGNPIPKLKQLLEEGDIFREKIPECNWKKFITKCISKKPENRYDIKEIIEFLIKKENCLEGVNYDEFQKYIKRKFSINDEKIDDTQLFKKIQTELLRNDSKSSKKIQAGTCKVSDISSFIDLAKDTTFGAMIKKNCYDFLQVLLRCKFQNEDDRNKFIDSFLRHNSNDSLPGKLRLMNLENMNGNSSFILEICKQNAEINFYIPEKLNLPEDSYDFLNNNQQFVHFADKTFKMIPFYPFLNVYNILYGYSSKYSFERQQKMKWLYQISQALSILHENQYTMYHFNSTNVFIDLKLDAHLLPSKMIQCTNQTSEKIETDFFENSNFIISYFAPEIISDIFNDENTQISEKQIVYSFGIFILELIYDKRPGEFTENLSIKEKKQILLLKRSITGYEQDDLFKLMQSCIDHNPGKRKSFKEISDQLGKILDNKNENTQDNENQYSFVFGNLEEAQNKGATTPKRILNYIYNTFNFDEKLSVDSFMNHNPKTSIYNLVWSVYVHDFDKKHTFELQKREKKEINRSSNETKSQFKSFDSYSTCFLDNFKITMKKVHNRPLPYYLYLNGLTVPSAHQLMMRSYLNGDTEYRQQVKYVVINTHDYPYGDNLKMKTVKDFIDEMIDKKVFNEKSQILNTTRGNIMLDSQTYE